MSKNKSVYSFKWIIDVGLHTLIWSLILFSLSLSSVKAQQEVDIILAVLEGIPTNFEAQAQDFQELYPDIDIAVTIMAEQDNTTTQLEAMETPVPIIVLLPYNPLALLLQAGYLQPLDDLVNLNLEDYSLDAVDSNRFADFDGSLYGLPLFQYGCYPTYYNLALVNGSENPEVAFELMAFLMQPEQQRENFETWGWYPTHKELYQEVASDCPEITPVPRPSVDDVALAMDVVTSLSDTLAPVLEDKVLNPLTTAIIVVEIDEETTFLQRVAAPVTEIDTGELANGAIVGAMRIAEDDEFLPAGDYAVRCTASEGTASCTLVDAEGNDVDDAETEWVDPGILPGPPVAVAATQTIYILIICIR